MKNIKIKDITIATTYRCNSRCVMCNIWKRTDHEDEMTLEHFARLPKTLRDINLSGGEPFLRKDIVGIVKTIKKRIPKAKIIISSNGFATDLILEKMKEIIKLDPSIGVAISLDGMDKKHNEIRRVEGGFEKALKTIKGLKALGLRNLKIAFTLSDQNHEDFKNVYNLSKDLKTEFTLAVVHSAENFFGKENKIEKKQLLIDELNWLIKQELGSYKPKRWLRAYFAFGLTEFIKNGKRVLPDYSGKTNIFVDSKGVAFPCDISSEKVGELTKTGFKINEAKNMEENSSWMICTARQAMKNHPVKVVAWIIKNKFLNVFWYKLFRRTLSL